MSAKVIKAAANLVEGGFNLVGEGGIVRLGYSRDDAVENLRRLGEKRRSIAGPVPPSLSDKTFAQGATSKEEAIMAGTTKFMQDGEAKQIRNYGAPYAPAGQVQSRSTRQRARGMSSEGVKQRDIDVQTQTLEEAEDFYKGANPEADAHHIAGLAMYRWAFEGLNATEQQELAKWLMSKGVPTGNNAFNRADLNSAIHMDLHDWMRENKVEFAGKGVEMQGRSMKERKAILEDFVEFIQGAANEKMFELQQNR
jgi:hypothetical protein